MKISLNCCFFNMKNVEKKETLEEAIQKAKAIKEKRKNAELDDEVFSEENEETITLYESFMARQQIYKAALSESDEKISWIDFVKSGK